MLDSIFLIVICDSTSQHGVRFERGRYDLCFTKDTGQKDVNFDASLIEQEIQHLDDVIGVHPPVGDPTQEQSWKRTELV